MKCNCKPIQKLPHIVRSDGGKAHFLYLPYWKWQGYWRRYNSLFIQWMKYKTMPIDCEGNEVKQWGYIYSFGKRLDIWG